MIKAVLERHRASKFRQMKSHNARDRFLLEEVISRIAEVAVQKIVPRIPALWMLRSEKFFLLQQLWETYFYEEISLSFFLFTKYNKESEKK